ncbi:hypothetical protein N6H14_25855 [Paenibacillus sp. CC-CFT747]|nr:hypothetical protein N6H14_25855 [Paenibacillus sp. CC-CFT747]
MMSRFPLRLLFGDVEAVKRQMITTALLFTLLFVIITFLLLSTITRPLALLQKKMQNVVRQQLKTHLPTGSFRGNCLPLLKPLTKWSAI